jgi:hypothetical protein
MKLAQAGGCVDPITPVVNTNKASSLSAIQFKGEVEKDGTFAGFPTREDPSRHPIEIAVLVPTANGGTPAFPGDWIVSTDGNLSVVSGSIFASHYRLSASSKPDPSLPSAPPVRPAWRLTPQQIAGQKAAAAARQAEIMK